MKSTCIHYHICINSASPLCSDSQCAIIKHIGKVEDIIRKDKVRQTLDEYKRQLGVDSFLELNVNKKF